MTNQNDTSRHGCDGEKNTKSNTICRQRQNLESQRKIGKRSGPQELRNPIILSNDQPLVKLLLQHYHQKLAHCG